MSGVQFRFVSILVCCLLPTASVFAAPFEVGAAIIDVTPERFPVAVNCSFTQRLESKISDPLHARCLILQQGSTRILLMVVDNCMMPREFLDLVKQQIQESLSIPIERQLISATHTHTAPAVMGCLGSDPDPKYREFLMAHLVRVARMADSTRTQAEMGYTVINAESFTHNRRWILRSDRMRADPFGRTNVRANMHPGYQSPDFIGPSGPKDPDLTIVSFRKPNGPLLAVLSNFSMHYFGSSGVSADYFGEYCATLSQELAKNQAHPVVMMSQGTSGDLQWMDYSQSRPWTDRQSYVRDLVNHAKRGIETIKYEVVNHLDMDEQKVTFSRRLPSEEQLRWAKEIVKKQQTPLPISQPEIYAREQLLIHQDQRRELRLQSIRMNEFAIAAIPNEVFAITGLKLKRFSPFQTTCVIELANGAEGYIPPPEQHTLGGYTTWPARTAGLSIDAEPQITGLLLKSFEKLANRPRKTPPPIQDDATKLTIESKPNQYFHFEELSGEILHSHIGMNHATREPGVVFGLDGPALESNRMNRCIHFAGGRIRSQISSTTEFTISGWVWNGMPTEDRPITGYLISSGQDGDQQAKGVHLGISGKALNRPGVLFLYNGNRHQETALGKTPLMPKKWYHFAWVQRGSESQLYLNGELELQHQWTSSLDFSPTLFFGGRSDGFSGLEGRLDEVSIFPKALSPQTIHKLSTTSKSIP
ncbi:LamG domain-containing protein [Tuwongella immobilis]|uniref:Neutral/alkaline non-lysosomal ceramidase N-terminal domain-containing protein n=1 Tax=Tuwongella immobilis TaxID=692036 RepID=A0A6C2YML1_9BACT